MGAVVRAPEYWLARSLRNSIAGCPFLGHDATTTADRGGGGPRRWAALRGRCRCVRRTFLAAAHAVQNVVDDGDGLVDERTLLSMSHSARSLIAASVIPARVGRAMAACLGSGRRALLSARYQASS